MNPTTESRLWLQIRATNLTAHQAMVVGHMNMVYDVTRKYQSDRSRDEQQDLVGVGCLGLCLAVDTYAASLAASEGARPDCRFSTYAYRRIQRAISEHLAEDGPIMRRESVARAEREADLRWEKLSQEKGREPSGTEFRDHHPRREAELNLVRPRYVDVDSLAGRNSWPGSPAPVEPAVPEAGAVVERAWDELPSSTRALFSWLTDSFAETGNASLSQFAHYLEENRQDLADRLREVGEVFSPE